MGWRLDWVEFGWIGIGCGKMELVRWRRRVWVVEMNWNRIRWERMGWYLLSWGRMGRAEMEWVGLGLDGMDGVRCHGVGRERKGWKGRG